MPSCRSIKEENLSMNKKLMALAVAGALAPAAAWAQNYSVYGRLTLGVDTYEAKGATDLAGNAVEGNDFRKRARVFDNGSRVGFRGTEDLGGGVRAEFLIETGVNVDNGSTTGQGGQANSSSGVWGSRVGHVGLAGSWGLVTWGRSNVYWTNGAIEQVGANWLNIGAQLFTGTFGRGMGVGVTRVSNTMQYTSPTWAGVNAVLSFSPSRNEAQANGQNVDARAIGVTLQGTHGPFAWGIDSGKDEGVTAMGTGVQGANTALKLRAGFRYMPAGQISVLSVNNKSENGGPAQTAGSTTGLPASCATVLGGCEFKQSGIGISWDHMFGPWHPIVQYYVIDDIDGSGCAATVAGAGTVSGPTTATQVNHGDKCTKTGANQITLGLRYVFSKRTHAYVSYNKVDNDIRYNQDFTGAAMTSRTLAATGADPVVIAAGMIHNF
jgi:predicted porin